MAAENRTVVVNAAATAGCSEDSPEVNPTQDNHFHESSSDCPSPVRSGPVAPGALPDTAHVAQGKQRLGTWRTRFLRAAGIFCKVCITLQLIATAYDLLPFGTVQQRTERQQGQGSFNKQRSRAKYSGQSSTGRLNSSRESDSHMDKDELLSTVGHVIMFLSGDGQEGASELQQIGPSKLQQALEIIDTEVLEVMQVEVSPGTVLISRVCEARRCIASDSLKS